MKRFNTPLTKEAAKSLLALDLEDKVITSYEKLDECMEQLWHEFDTKTDINAALAYQIDKLEPLVQLYIYRSALPDEQRRYQLESWVQKANEQLSMCKVQTSFGSNVLEFLSTYLLGDDFFIY